MLAQKVPIDFIVYDVHGNVVLLAEVRSRQGTSEAWAAKFRRNMLAHGVLPPAKYFLIATPERMYGWNQDKSSSLSEVLPQFTIDAKKVLAPYFAKLNQFPATISPKAFELLMLTWLTDIAGAADSPAEFDSSLASLSESGLLSSLRQAQIEMNPAR